MTNREIALNHVDLTLNDTRVFTQFSLTFKPRGLSLLVGANGSGKTQLLKLIHGLTTPQAGTVSAPGSSRQVLLYQSPILLNRSVMQNLQFLRYSAYYDHVYFTQQLPVIIEQFELTDMLSQNALRLSGGQQKRVAMARLLLQKADYYLFDEPTANVDYHTGLLLESVMDTLLQQEKKIIVTTHDVVQMERLFSVDRDEIVLLSDGQLITQSDHLDWEQLKCYL